jgi:hypothetical protein
MSFKTRPNVEPERQCKEDTRTEQQAVLNAAEAACRRDSQSNLPAGEAEYGQGRNESGEQYFDGHVELSISYATPRVCASTVARGCSDR